MSDGEISAVAGGRETAAGVGRLGEDTGTVFLSREEIARLAEGGTHCLIISLPSEYRRFGDADEAVIIGGAPAKRRTLGQRALHAIAVGTCIGASTGLSVASTFVVMTQKAPTGVVAFIERAMTLFA